MQQAQQRFSERGLRVAALSYDSRDILRDFAQRRGIIFPLLSDPQSQVIREFGVLNESAHGLATGVAHPGFVYIDASGIVRDKYFGGDIADRYTANNALARMFPELLEGVERTIDAPHVKIQLEQSDTTAAPGSRVTFAVRLVLPPGVHVYAPGANGYKPVALAINSTPEIAVQPAEYPEARQLYLKAINETAPVYEGSVLLRADAVISNDKEFTKSIGDQKTLALAGELAYQACDEKTCYLPQQLPVNWPIEVTPLDVQRSPASIRHRNSEK